MAKARKMCNLRKCSKAYVCDVTINDFANSSTPKTGRIKKNEINKVISEVKHLSVAEDDKSWNEKLRYLDGKKQPSGKKRGSKRSLKNKGREKEEDAEVDPSSSSLREREIGFTEFPLEIWFRISDFIPPEDVGRFAAICKKTLAVVSSARFWFKLYKRYYKDVGDLPKVLQPQCMFRKYGIRTNVIRALHFMYPPFVQKLKSEILFNGDPHALVKRLCLLSWAKKKENQWLFYFKLKKYESVKYGREDSEVNSKPGLLEMLEDISANIDEDCKVLEVKNMNYIPLPMTFGQVLNSVSLTLSQDLQNHRLELNFGSGSSPHIGNNYILLDTVMNIRVLDWWHPSFPHLNGLNDTSHYSKNGYLIDEIEF